MNPTRQTAADSGFGCSTMTNTRTPCTATAGVEILATNLNKLITTMALPQTTLPTFKGNSRKEYWEFIREFSQHVDRKAVPEEYKLQMLMKACSEGVRNTLLSCEGIEPVEGYRRALALLENRYGDKDHYVREIVNAMLQGPVIKEEDEGALRKFADELESNISSLEAMGMLYQLDTLYAMDALSHRLPENTFRRYEDESYSVKKRCGSFPGIRWLKTFILEEVDRASNRKVNRRRQGANARRHSDHISEHGTRRSTMSLATIGRANPEHQRLMCPICKGNTHGLTNCRTFRAMTVPERRDTVRKLRYCYVCLNNTHFAADCQATVWCDIPGCTGKHSRWLHPSDVMMQGNRGRPQLREMGTTRNGDRQRAGVAIQETRRDIEGAGPGESSTRRPYPGTSKGLRANEERNVKHPRLETDSSGAQ